MNNIDYMTIIISLGLCLVLYAMPFTRHHIMAPYSTVIHEYGHAVANLCTLGIPTGIKVYWNHGGGVTHSLRGAGVFSGFGAVISGLSGYPAPILVGYLMIIAVPGGYAEQLVQILFVISLVMLLLIRNFFGLFIALFTSGYLFAASAYFSLYPQLVSFGGMFLLVMGIMDLVYLLKLYFTGRSEESDLGLLKESFYLPQFVWLVLMIAEIVMLLWFSTYLTFK